MMNNERICRAHQVEHPLNDFGGEHQSWDQLSVACAAMKRAAIRINQMVLDGSDYRVCPSCTRQHRITRFRIDNTKQGARYWLCSSDTCGVGEEHRHESRCTDCAEHSETEKRAQRRLPMPGWEGWTTDPDWIGFMPVVMKARTHPMTTRHEMPSCITAREAAEIEYDKYGIGLRAQRAIRDAAGVGRVAAELALNAVHQSRRNG